MLYRFGLQMKPHSGAAALSDYGIWIEAQPFGHIEIIPYTAQHTLTGTLGDLGIENSSFTGPNDVISFADVDTIGTLTNGRVVVRRRS